MVLPRGKRHDAARVRYGTTSIRQHRPTGTRLGHRSYADESAREIAKDVGCVGDRRAPRRGAARSLRFSAAAGCWVQATPGLEESEPIYLRHPAFGPNRTPTLRAQEYLAKARSRTGCHAILIEDLQCFEQYFGGYLDAVPTEPGRPAMSSNQESG